MTTFLKRILSDAEKERKKDKERAESYKTEVAATKRILKDKKCKITDKMSDGIFYLSNIEIIEQRALAYHEDENYEEELLELDSAIVCASKILYEYSKRTKMLGIINSSQK